MWLPWQARGLWRNCEGSDHASLITSTHTKALQPNESFAADAVTQYILSEICLTQPLTFWADNPSRGFRYCNQFGLNVQLLRYRNHRDQSHGA
jgi:hypothetical protein